MVTGIPQPQQCFLSYAHHDHAAFARLQAHLGAYAKTLGFSIWADTRIAPGQYWHQRIQDEIDRSQIFVLLTTADFLNSGYILKHEMPAILQRHTTHGALVVPVISGPCGWQGFFGNYIQVVPVEKGRLKPVPDWRPTEKGFHAAADAVGQAVQGWFGIVPRSPFAIPGVPTP